VLPESIPVRYTEEEAGYVSFRPVVRQTFRLNELLDMVLSVTGKEPERVRQILRSGTVVFHFYRYTWVGFEVDPQELAGLLARFPDADPSRPFRAASCTVAVLATGGAHSRVLLELERARASQHKLLRRGTFWDALLAEAQNNSPAYSGYSYARHADLYRLALDDSARAALAAAAQSLALRSLRTELHPLAEASEILFVCPREGA
jgi:hypothetical protein